MMWVYALYILYNTDYYLPCSKVPAFLNVVDIAGLVKGAHEGQGLGNAFLSHISACDALFHMSRECLCYWSVLSSLFCFLISIHI